MTHKQKILLSAISVMGVFVLATPALAQTVTATSTSATSTGALATTLSKANQAIAARITALNNLDTRIQQMKNEPASEQATIASEVQTNIAGLTTLQAKIDADTSVSTARTDAATIFTTYRIYALVIPQGYILASADRVTTITGLMTALAEKIDSRITADQTAGMNVSALVSTYAQMNADIADANTQAASAQSGVSSLVPDQGNASVIASNKAALVAGHADILKATQDLVSARNDISTLLQGLKDLGSSNGAATSTSVQQ